MGRIALVVIAVVATVAAVVFAALYLTKESESDAASAEQCGDRIFGHISSLTAKGDHLIVVFNGKKTVDTIGKRNHLEGPFALQWGRGVIKWRKVQIREL